MKVVDLGTAVQVKDIDLYNDEECLELGRIAAHECVVFIDDCVEVDRLYDIQQSWGETCIGTVNRSVLNGNLKGSHWRKLFVYLGTVGTKKHGGAMTRVSFEKDARGRPIGVFANGELDWHADKQTMYESQRIAGLMSLYDTANSQTTFLRTFNIYDGLNHEDKSMVDELISVSAWNGHLPAYELNNDAEKLMGKNHYVPIDGVECSLKDHTITGREGIRMPGHLFSHFKGMSIEDSMKYKDHLWSILNKPENIHTRNWKDGQIMFMDQNITLHARPTNVSRGAGSRRTLARTVTFLNRLFDNGNPVDYVVRDGKRIYDDELIKLVDEIRRNEFLEE